ncbi:hypothetical protein ACFO0M_10025 [Micromonospora mangrovi]|uniref:Uncharacterized protein n=2 Tax=Micromonospora TaxID=1873 RepID=A0AAU7M678_9ACTN
MNLDPKTIAADLMVSNARFVTAPEVWAHIGQAYDTAELDASLADEVADLIAKAGIGLTWPDGTTNTELDAARVEIERLKTRVNELTRGAGATAADSDELPPTTETPFEAAHRLAPQPATRDTATRDAWIRHYAAEALAAYAVFQTEINAHLAAGPHAGSRLDLGYLILAAGAATTTAAALADPADAPNLIWDLTPEAGALNGEWQDWLVETLVKHGVNPGHIDREYDPDDFADALAAEPSDEPYVCPECGETAYLHFPQCSIAAARVTP